jgi:hypothetical protein
MDKVITLEFSIAEVNAILGALAQKPYAEVATLLTRIKHSAELQVNGDQPQEATDGTEG